MLTDEYIAKVKGSFSRKFGADLTVEIKREGSSYGIVVKYANFPHTFISLTLSGNAGYIDMINVEEKVRGKRLGGTLMRSAIWVIKQMGGTVLEAHVTDIRVLKILEKMYRKDKMKFYRKGLLGVGSQISYEQAIAMKPSNFMLFVDI